jgi:hypothetical protein
MRNDISRNPPPIRVRHISRPQRPCADGGVRPKRAYRYMGLDWKDPEMRRAYDREQQRAWRAKNGVRK